MKIHWSIFTSLLLILTSCGENKSNKSSAEISKLEISKDHPAYSNAEELNKRPSPPKTETLNGSNGIEIAAHYSSPRVKDRTIWGELVPYNEVWRTGANEATVLHFKQDVKINGELIEKGKYGLFTVPNKDSWTIIINENYDQWGAYDYEKSQDVLRFSVPTKDSDFTEKFRISLSSKDANIAQVKIAWEKVAVSFDVAKAK